MYISSGILYNEKLFFWVYYTKDAKVGVQITNLKKTDYED